MFCPDYLYIIFIMDEFKIVVTNKKSPHNKKLLTFIRRNLSRTVSHNIKFFLTVAHAEDKDYYDKRGITSFPTLSYKGRHISGVDRINAFIQDMVRKRSEEASNQPVGEMLDDYFKKSLGDRQQMENEGDEASANPDDMGRNFMGKVQDELERRNMKTEHLHTLEKKKHPSELPPSQRPAQTRTAPSAQSQRKNNVEEEEDSPISDAMKNLKPQSSQEAQDDALMAKYFENQLMSGS